MFNPLLPDLSSLKNDDIDNKIVELMKRYTVASRFGQGGVCEQILVLLEAYRSEQSARHQAAIQKMIKNQDKDLDDFINIDR